MTHVKVPPVLSQFADALIAKQRPFVRIEATPLDAPLDRDPLELHQSKFLGSPFIPEDAEYPKDTDGNPLILLVQINFAEAPDLDGFPSEGMLQVFFNPNEWSESVVGWDSRSNAGKIVYLSAADLQKTPRTTFPVIDPEAYAELPIESIHSLTFEKSIDTGNSEDFQFAFDFGELDYWEFEESLSEADGKAFKSYFSRDDGHKLGGYAYFTQGDIREYEGQEDYDLVRQNDVQLLQLDSDEEMMFGDSGVGHVFISPEALADRDFSKAYFYWDCC
ncbi:MAG: YwqG family protein [Geitlerinemataceae cyanobacterium]